MIRVRVDDFPHTSKREPQHTLDAFREFDRELRSCIGKRYLLGVIPKQCTPEDVVFLRNETDCVIGMHGILHDETLLDAHGNEFPPYLSRNDVGRALVEAARALDEAVGRRTEIYMPPRNRIDRRTADVLFDCGFFYYTTGPETDEGLRAGRVRPDRAMYLHSEKPHEYGRTDELLQLGSHERLVEKSKNGFDVILTLHWTWEVNVGLHHMREFFSRIPKEHFRDF